MDAYLDTGVLLPLYVPEGFTAAVTEFLETRGKAVPISAFHQLEMENAVRLKVFRGDIDLARAEQVLLKIAAHLAGGQLVSRPVNWSAVLQDARLISRQVSMQTGCRSLDLIHVATARQWECRLLVTADDRQAQAARAVGLAVADLRTWHSADGQCL